MMLARLTEEVDDATQVTVYIYINRKQWRETCSWQAERAKALLYVLSVLPCRGIPARLFTVDLTPDEVLIPAERPFPILASDCVWASHRCCR